MANEQTRRRLRAQQQRTQRTARPGSGARFRALERSIAAGGARNPGAVAAAIGRRKFGNRRFNQLSAMGRARGRR